MKTVEEIALEIAHASFGLTQNQLRWRILAALKDQDKITRHVCSENVKNSDSTTWISSNVHDGIFISLEDAESAIMDVKEV